jgi:putative nucleotidyltransferase with HDIG domain
VRLANQFGFRIEAETEAQLCRLARTIQFVSPERVRDELWKILHCSMPDRGIEHLHDVGLLAFVLPEVVATVGVEQSFPHLYPVYEHTLNTVQNAARLRDWVMGESVSPPNQAHAFMQRRLGKWQHRLRHHLDTVVGGGRRRADWLIWFALLHDIGKPPTRSLEIDADGITRTRFFGHEAIGADLAEQRLTDLRFSRNEVELARAVVTAHMRPHHLHMSFLGQPISPRAMFRFFREIGGKQSGTGPGLDVLLLALADRLSVTQDIPPDDTGYTAHIDQLFHNAFAEATHEPQPLVDGHMLMQRLALQPGPRVGALIEHILEAQAAGEIKTPDEALALAAGWLGQDGA